MAWTTINPANVTGLGQGSTPGTGSLTSGVAQAAATAPANHPPLWSPDNPMFWVGVLAVGTVGLWAISVNVKAGGAKASLSL